jgi:hypothetical protein
MAFFSQICYLLSMLPRTQLATLLPTSIVAWFLLTAGLALAAPTSPTRPAAVPVAAPAPAAESLSYRVSWGPLSVGNATITHQPGSTTGSTTPYTLTAEVNDNTILINLHNIWVAQGIHQPGRTFQSRTYRSTQTENDYRAKKLLTFTPGPGKKQTITYVNELSPADVEPPLVTTPLRDVLSTLFVLRAQGIAAVAQGTSLTVMGTKRPFNLVVSPPVSSTIVLNNQRMPVWQVNLRTVTPGKPSTDIWTIALAQTPALTPVRIVANTKFGSFTATIKK